MLILSEGIFGEGTFKDEIKITLVHSRGAMI